MVLPLIVEYLVHEGDRDRSRSLRQRRECQKYRSEDYSCSPDHLKAGVIAVIRFDVDSLDLRVLRAAPRPAHDGVHGGGFALHRGFHRAVAAVAHPACDPKPLRFTAHRVAEEHALHSTMDNECAASLRATCFHRIIFSRAKGFSIAFNSSGRNVTHALDSRGKLIMRTDRSLCLCNYTGTPSPYHHGLISPCCESTKYFAGCAEAHGVYGLRSRK